LCRGGKQELVLCYTSSAQWQAAKLEDALEMRKQHLDPFAISTGLLEGGRTMSDLGTSRASSLMSRGILRGGVLGQHRGLSEHLL